MTDFDLLLIFAGSAEQSNAGADVIVGAGRPGCHTSRLSG
jgi:hypothetical protein